jgi:hypothetical protein
MKVYQITSEGIRKAYKLAGTDICQPAIEHFEKYFPEGLLTSEFEKLRNAPDIVEHSTLYTWIEHVESAVDIYRLALEMNTMPSIYTWPKEKRWEAIEKAFFEAVAKGEELDRAKQ